MVLLIINKPMEAKASPQLTDKIVVANPTDLSKIQAITKFRSCFGHEFGYTSGFGGAEAKSSLKHYIVWNDEYQDVENSVPIYAVFDGEIIITEIENDQFLIEQRPFAGWVVTYTHVVLQPGLKVGSEVTAGQLIAYAETHSSHAFDIALQANEQSSNAKNNDWYNNYESIFDHMSEAVLTEYSARGVTLENIIISKEFRDQAACECDYSEPAYEGSPYCHFPPVDMRDPDNAVMLD